MSRRRFMLLAVALVALNSFFWLAQGSFALPRALIVDLFGPRMIRAEVVDLAPDGSAQDQFVDRGVIRAVTQSSIMVFELDGNTATIAISPSTTVTGRVFGINRLRRGMRVLVVRPANGPATQIQVGG